MENLLTIYYSQTGQLKEILVNFLKPWTLSYHVDYTEIKSNDFSFPMNYRQFFDVFPESVLHCPCEIHYEMADKNYDCVLLGFQSWFLHTSIPFQSFMQTDEFKCIVKNKPVILLMDARNSWRNTLNEVITETEKNGGIVKGIYVFRDTSKNHTGFISLCYWLFTGRKKPPIRFLPAGGVAQDIIDSADIHGAEALKATKGTNTAYTIIPHVNEEFTSIKYERFAVDKYTKWAEFISRNNFKYRTFKMFLFRTWILFTFIVLSPVISRRSKNELNIKK
jgi:hypothetical protein